MGSFLERVGGDSEFVSLPLLLQPTEVTALPLFRRPATSRPPRRCREPLHLAQLDLFRAGRWRVVDVELACASLWHVGRLELYDFDDAAPAAGQFDPDRIARSHRTVRFAVIAVDLNPATFACGLRLRASLEETRHVEPNIEADGVLRRHDAKFGGRRRSGQAGPSERRLAGSRCLVRVYRAGGFRNPDYWGKFSAARPTEEYWKPWSFIRWGS
jgi:hypothetical protein